MLLNYLLNYIYSGPKLEEVAIFWQMVMEQKPAVVVMLTKVEENGKVSSLCTRHKKLLCTPCMPSSLNSMQSVLNVDVHVPYLFIICNNNYSTSDEYIMCMRTHHAVQIAPYILFHPAYGIKFNIAYLCNSAQV